MRKLVSAVLALALCFALAGPALADGAAAEVYPAGASNNAIVVSNSGGLPDAHLVHPAVYKIDGANYFRLRDLAMLLNGSERQFAVAYDDASKTVSLSSGKPYAAIGGELTGAAAERAEATVSNDVIYIDGEIAALTVYKINGANYFKLRDLGRALDFFVGYNDEMKTVTISGAKGYEEEIRGDP